LSVLSKCKDFLFSPPRRANEGGQGESSVLLAQPVELKQVCRSAGGSRLCSTPCSF